MANRHMCIDSCFDGVKLRNKQPINCFYCKKKFNPKCFNINIQFKDNDNIIFLCFKCINITKEHSKNQKSILRNSINNQSISNHHINNNKVNNNINDGKISIIQETNDKLSELSSLLEQHIKIIPQKVNINQDWDIILQKLDNIQNILLKSTPILDQMYSKKDSKDDLSKIIQIIDTKHNEIINNFQAPINLGSNSDNYKLMDWSLHNNSIINDTNISFHQPNNKKSIDDMVLELLQNSEKRTWDTLDILTK